MNSPAILRLPEQMVAEWMGEAEAHRKMRGNGQLLQRKLVGVSKTMEPVYSYFVAYPRPRHIAKL